MSICKKCGNPSIPIQPDVVQNFVGEAPIETESWASCLNPLCDVVYFSKSKTLLTANLNQPIWFKTKGEDAPICYCSDITRGEIRDAVAKGHDTIKAIHDFTKKNAACNCKKLNPLGVCCHEAFQFEINQIKSTENKEKTMKIEILGTGCPKCKTLTQLVTQAVADNDIEAIISKVEDIKEIMSYGVMSTPGLVIDGEVKLVGRVPAMKELVELLKGSAIAENKKDAEPSTSSCGCGSGGCC